MVEHRTIQREVAANCRGATKEAGIICENVVFYPNAESANMSQDLYRPVSDFAGD